MKTVVWIVILFAAAVGLALASGIYTGNVYVVVEQTMLRINLHAFVLGLLLSVFVLYFLIKFVFGLLNIPARMQRFGIARKGRQASASLNSAGLAYFEGRFEKAEQEAAKVLQNKEAGDNRTLALMLGAHAADQMENFELRDRYLHEIEQLPQKQQLSRHLLLAESALSRRDYPTAAQNLEAAAKINSNLSRLVRLQLRYAFDHGDASDVLAKAEKTGQSRRHQRLRSRTVSKLGISPPLKRSNRCGQPESLFETHSRKHEVWRIVCRDCRKIRAFGFVCRGGQMGKNPLSTKPPARAFGSICRIRSFPKRARPAKSHRFGRFLVAGTTGQCATIDVSWPTGLRPQTLGQSPRLPRSQHRPATQRIRTFGLGSRV